MRARHLLISTAILMISVGTAVAQNDRIATMRRDADRAQTEADASPSRPGDESLTCEQIQAELDASMESEDVEQNMSELEEVEESQTEMNRRAQRGSGGGWGAALGSMLPGMAPTPNASAQAARQQSDTARAVGAVSGLSPSIMRNAHLYQLAQNRDCPFVHQQSD